MEIKRKDLFEIIIKNAARIVPIAYYSYDTGTVGSSYIAEAERQEVLAGNKTASTIFKVVDTLLEKSIVLLKSHNARCDDQKSIEQPAYDNKVAVECIVPGIDHPVFLSFYDWRYAICLEINTNRGGTRYPVPTEGIAAGL